MEEYKNKYEEALDNFKKIKAANKDNKELVDFIEYNYPELKESEDERIRRDIIRYLKKTSPAIGENIEKMLAWLEKQGEKIDAIENFDTEFEKQVSHLIASAINKEHEYNQSYVKWTANALLNYAKHELKKQGEQKPTDEIKPKFKVEDWIVDKSGFAQQVLDFRGRIYTCTRNSFTTDCESNYHLWTIQDAKDGDVLATPLLKGYESWEQIFIFKEINCRDYVSNCIEYYCRVYRGVFYENKINFMGTTDGIFHPATKEQRDLLFTKMKEAGYEWDAEKKKLKKIEEKSAWSEEDEKMWATVSDLLWEGYKLSDKKVSWYNIRYWLLPKIICLKDRVQPQPKQEWSEEEKARIDKIIDVLDWAEEKGYLRYSDWEDYVSYVKTLRSQNTWKPSDEQMEALWNAIPHIPNSEKDIDTITELSVLYNDLKKLKE